MVPFTVAYDGCREELIVEGTADDLVAVRKAHVKELPREERAPMRDQRLGLVIARTSCPY